jgi:hypothetical protein
MIDPSKVTVYADRIFYFESILDDPEYAIHMHKNMDELLESDNQDVFHKLGPWQTSDDVPHVYGTKRMSTKDNLDKTNNEEVKTFYKKIDSTFDEAGRYYFNALGLDYQDGKIMTDFASFHYTTGQMMGPHVDDDYQIQVDPICTGLIYLNDNKVGGDLWFPDQDLTIKATPGSMVIFPCVKPFFHSSTEIKEGEKYHIGTGWKRHRSQEEMAALGPDYGRDVNHGMTVN